MRMIGNKPADSNPDYWGAGPFHNFCLQGLRSILQVGCVLPGLYPQRPNPDQPHLYKSICSSRNCRQDSSTEAATLVSMKGLAQRSAAPATNYYCGILPGDSDVAPFGVCYGLLVRGPDLWANKELHLSVQVKHLYIVRTSNSTSHRACAFFGQLVNIRAAFKTSGKPKVIGSYIRAMMGPKM